MGARTVLILVLGACALPTAVAVAAKPGTFAGTVGVRVPPGAQADVRAINRATGVVARAGDVSRNGRFSLSLARGTYLVVGTVVTPAGRIVQKDVGVSLRPGQRRRGSSLTARPRKRRPRGRAAYVQEKGNVTPGRIAVEIPNATGSTGDPDWDALRGGINDLMMTDLFLPIADCGISIIEVERRADIIKELEFQQSPYVDPSTRVVRNFIIGDVELRSVIAAAPGGDAALTTTYVDKASGRELGSATRTLTRDGAFEQLEAHAKAVAEDLCKLSDVYEVRLVVAGEGRFATHGGTGAINATLRARRTERGRNVWRASGPLQWGSVAFTTKTECAMTDYVVPVISWSVTIRDAGDDELQVTWLRDGNDGTTASVDCPPDGENDPPPIPGQPGVALLNTGPETFTVPYAGGRQAISGVVQDGGDGFFNTGTVTVTPSGVG